MKNASRFIASAFLLIAVMTVNAFAQATAATIHGSVHPLALRATDNGSVAAAMPLHNIQLYLAPSNAQQIALAQLLVDQRTPDNAHYRQWLTPQQFGAKFGVSASDEAKVTTWLASQGFTGISLSRSRAVISCSGTAAQASKAFNTTIHTVTLNGVKHYANLSGISVPSNLGTLIQSVRGLDDFKPQNHSHRLSEKATPQYTAAPGIYGLVPGDIATIYDIQALYNAGVDGTGVTAAVVGQSDIDLADITAYRNTYNLPNNLPTVVLAAGSPDPGTSTGDLIEADLDLEVLGAVARNAKLVYVNSTNAFTSLEYAIDQNLAQIISMSFGSCEANVPTANQQSLQFLAQEANAQGITLVVASGDTGAADCDTGGKAATKGLAVDFPSSMPEFTSVGGTSFVSPPASYFSSTNKADGSSALSYIPEVAWNDSVMEAYPSASGGGVSTVYTKPGWQTGIGVPEDGFRDVPDVAMFSEDQANSDAVGYIICTGGGCSSGAPNLIGGTSASAPVFAGIVALLNNDLIVNNQIQVPGLGNINPHLYSLAGNSSDVFHDVTQGSNIVPCAANTTDCTSGSYGYAAGPGYDQVTGLGTVDTFNLLKEWNNVSTNGTTTTLSAPISPVVNNSTLTLTAKVAPGTGNTIPTGSITFYSYAASISTLAVLGTANLDGTGAATLANTNIEGDVTSIYAAYAGSADFTQSFSQTLQVYTPTSVTLAPSATQSIQGSSVTFTALVSGVYASTVATVSFNNGSTLLGTASLSNGTATLTTSALPIGTDSITANYAGGSIYNFEASTSAPVIVTVTPTAPLATTTTLAASPTQATQGDAVTLTATVLPASGTTAPTGTVSFNNGSTLLGTASLSDGTATLITSTLPIGSDSITANYAATAIYTASTSAAISVTIAAIPVPNFTIATTASTLTVAGGSTASTTLTITPVNGFDQALSFTCTGLPAGSACTFGAPVALANGNSTVALSISTTTLSASASQGLPSNAPLFALLPMVVFLSIKRRKAFLKALSLVALFAVVMSFGAVGCGGGATATTTTPKSQTSTVTVTAHTTTGTSHAVALTLTVN